MSLDGWNDRVHRDRVGRWDAPWQRPTGSRPQRPDGEPSLAVLAAVHLSLLSVLAAAGSLLAPLGGHPVGAATVAALLCMTTGVAGLAALRRATPVMAWIADLLLAAAAVYAFAAGGGTAWALGADDADAALVGAWTALVCAGVAYLRHRRIWLQVATAAALVTALMTMLAQDDAMPTPVYGAFLVIVAAFTAAGTAADAVRPRRSGWVVASVLALVGAQVLLSGDVSAGYLVAPVILGLIGVGVVRASNASLLPVALLGSVVMLPQLLGPSLGLGYTIGVTGAVAGAGIAWLCVDVQRRSVRPTHTGGVFAVCTVLTLVTCWPLSHADSVAAAGVAVLALAALLGAAIAGGRRPAAILSGLLLLARTPEVLASGSGPEAVAGLVMAVGFAAAGILLHRRKPAAAPATLEQALTQPGREWVAVAAYHVVFDQVVEELTRARLPLQLVDRAAGRVVAGPAHAPVLVVAVWAADSVRTFVRASGDARDTERLHDAIQARLLGAPGEVVT